MDTPPDSLGEMPPLSDRATPAYPIASVENTLRILLLLGERDRLSLADVAAELDIARSSAHRLMAMLTYYDFVRQDSASRAFRPGAALVDVGLSAVRALDIRALARPVLTELAASTEMTAHLALPRGRDILYVDGVESRRTIRAALRTGDTLPAHVTGVGKALLATLSDDQLRQMYRDAPPQAVTDKSVSSVEALIKEAHKARKAGYGVNRGESEPGVLSLGVAVSLPEPGMFAGLGLVCPEATADPEWEPRIAARLQAAAAELAREMSVYRS
ncbi:IclR family transcriptional regulator [Streptomyces sp. BH-SS-21]|uniref:IclR family transcriptional regulator n=1 Tax=Streptomyces liliiviolaceus TaxID=2823109 RepID=A0A941BJ26_9ACTN|nr:IclR family transcriptional regulator [Streptomyces liliiviolaceus]MBQ0855539.1 IclR family transcriptional regulator [Streptomyces liliiviolaceus]